MLRAGAGESVTMRDGNTFRRRCVELSLVLLGVGCGEQPAGLAHACTRRFAPVRSARVVRDLWVMTGRLSQTGSAKEQLILPDGSAELVIHRSEPMVTRVGRPQFLLAGRVDGPCSGSLSGCFEMVGIRLRPGVVPSLTGVPAWSVQAQVDAGLVLPAPLRSALAEVAAAQTIEAAVEAADLALSGVETRPSEFAAMKFAERVRNRVGTSTSLAAIAREMGLSLRYIQRCFRDAVGVSPSKFARVIRFHAAVKRLIAGQSLAGAAASCGFADQPHFTREFGVFAGASPCEIWSSEFGFSRCLASTHARPAEQSAG